MDEVHFLITLLAGLAGTAAMSLVMYAYGWLTGQRTYVVHIFGAMVTASDRLPNLNDKAFWAGCFAHIGVGVLFSFAYFLLWNWGLFRIDFTDSFWIGLWSGLAAVIVWRSYFWLHRSPPSIHLPHFLLALILSHIVFGMVTVNLFSMITENPELWYELQEEAKV